MWGSPLTLGEETFCRFWANSSSAQAGASGTMLLTYFTAQKTESITTLSVSPGTAGAGLTLARYGVYSVGAAGALSSLLASSANNTSQWTIATPGLNGTNAAATLTSTFSKVAGTRYAIGLLAVGTTMPSFIGCTPMAAAPADCAQDPRVCGVVTGQANLPASVVSGSIANYGIAPYVWLQP
jgi:hypothetical protein